MKIRRKIPKGLKVAHQTNLCKVYTYLQEGEDTILASGGGKFLY